MLTLSQSLLYYKRKDVQKLILEHAQNKEIGVRFNESFGKRPDILVYENDILESAKLGATSFHCSEEIWSNPLRLNPNLRRNELDDLRTGWDLILDIDCPYWNFSKLTTYVFIKALKDHGIECVTVKFSGGKGFHIAVPFEAFPKKVVGVEVKNLFPEGPRKIAEYLLHYITENIIAVDKDKGIIKFGKVDVKFEKLLSDTGKTEKDLTMQRCEKCKRKIDRKKGDTEGFIEYVCPNCEYTMKDVDKKFITCPKCKRIMEKYSEKKTLCECGSDKVRNELDLSSIINVDTILISSRHMYRMPYSLHEKTGLVSVPFDIRHILKFDKKEGEQKIFQPYKFLDRNEAKEGEASVLFQKAFDHKPEKASKHREDMRQIFIKSKNEITSQNLSIDNTAIPEEFFPPCIRKINAGIEDGKKRALLVMINFLSSCNWEYDKIEEYVMKWNDKNKPDKLRETYIRGQLRYYKQQASHSKDAKDRMMPPNCDNRGYMIDTQFCNPDGLCKSIKNPVQYAKKRVWMMNNVDNKPKKRIKKDDKTQKSEVRAEDKSENGSPLV
ncbi:MAG: DNA primase small subunit domain-containing protein [Candidatus Woesearchaeota archaeon]